MIYINKKLQYISFYFFAITLFYISYLFSVIPLKIIFGIFGFILLPGVLIIKRIGNYESATFIFDAIIWGYIFQYFIFGVGFTLYWTLHVIMNPVFLLIIGNSFIVFVLLYSISESDIDFKISKFKDYLFSNRFILLAVLLGLIARLFYIFYNLQTILPDGALYFDYARNIVEEFMYYTKSLNDEIFAFASLDFGFLISHEFVSFPIAFSMIISNVSYTGARIAVLIPSLLVFVPIYKILKRIKSGFAAQVSTLLFLLSPFFIYFSAVLHGPEINAILLLMVIFDMLLHDPPSKLQIILSGLLLGISQMVWFPATYAFILFVPFIFLYNSKRNLLDSFVRLIIFEIFSVIFITVQNGLVKFGIFSSIIFAFSFIFAYSILRYNLIMHDRIFQLLGVFIFSIISRLGDVPAYIFQRLMYGNVRPSSRIVPVLLPTFESIMKTIAISSFNIGIVLVIIAVGYFLFNLKDKKTLLFGAGYIINIGLFATYLSPSPFLLDFTYLYDIGRYFHIANTMCIIGVSLLISKLFFRRRNYYNRVLLSFIIVLIVLNYSYAYVDRAAYIDYRNPIVDYGWSNAVPWINENVPYNESIACVQQRELAYFTNHVAIKFYNASEPNQEMTYNVLYMLLLELHPNYLLIDVPFKNVYSSINIYNITLQLFETYTIVNNTLIPSHSGHVLLRLVFQEYNMAHDTYIRIFALKYN